MSTSVPSSRYDSTQLPPQFLLFHPFFSCHYHTHVHFYVALLRLTTTTVSPRPVRPLPLILVGRRYDHYDMLWTSWAPLVPLLLVLTLGVALLTLTDRRVASYLPALIGFLCVLGGSASFLSLDNLTPYNIWMNTAVGAHLKELDHFCEEHARMLLFGAAIIWYGLSTLGNPSASM